MSSPRIVVMGPPGAGKTTQGNLLTRRYDIDHIQTGDLLRTNKDMETDWGKPREYIDQGEMVPNAMINHLVRQQLDKAKGFILDGFPRDRSQAAMLEDYELDAVVLLDCSTPQLIKRLKHRLHCPECGETYNSKSKPPAVSGLCDRCKAELQKREDDTSDAIQTRIDVYQSNTAPVIDYYREQDLLYTIDGESDTQSVFDSITDIISHSD